MNRTVTKRLKAYSIEMEKNKEANKNGLSAKHIYGRLKVAYAKGKIQFT